MNFYWGPINEDIGIDLSSYPMGKENVSSMICENPRVDFDLVLSPRYNRLHELRLGITSITGRIDAVHYASTDNMPGVGFRKANVDIEAYSNEIGLSVAYLIKTRKFGPFRAYGGMGTNLGLTYGGDVYVSTSEEIFTSNQGDNIPDTQFSSSAYEYYEQKAGIAQRLYAIGGLGVEIAKRVEIGFEWKYGLGYRYINSEANSLLTLQSSGLSLRYMLK